MNITLEVSFAFKSDLDEHPVCLELPRNADVNAALHALAAKYPQVAGRLFSPQGEVRPYINVLKNGGNVRFQRGFATPLKEGDHLTVIPPVGGG